MPRKKIEQVEQIEEIETIQIKPELIQSLDLQVSQNLHVSSAEIQQMVDKLNEVIKKVNQ